MVMAHRRALTSTLALAFLAALGAGIHAQAVTMKEYPLPIFSHPHDVAPAADGGIWYTPQLAGGLGWLDPSTGKTRRIAFGVGSQPHGVITGPDGTAWVTDEGLNAVVHVEPSTGKITRYTLPSSAPRAEMNTPALDGRGILWFTGQAGWYGRLDPSTGKLDVFPAPRGPGPYGMHALKQGPVWFVSLAAGYLGRIDPLTAALAVIDLPSEGQGPRRVWLDSRGAPWVTGWYSGKLLHYDPSSSSWRQFDVPGAHPRPYAVYVDEKDRVWLSDFGGNTVHLYDPSTGRYTTYPLPSGHAEIRQLAGRPGEVWGAESGANKLLVIRY
jgi:virginiamycin B lyase